MHSGLQPAMSVRQTLLLLLFSRGHITFLNCELFLHYCSCPIVRDCIAVYPASFGVYGRLLHYCFCSQSPFLSLPLPATWVLGSRISALVLLPIRLTTREAHLMAPRLWRRERNLEG